MPTETMVATVRRRRLLGAVGGTATSALAGCSVPTVPTAWGRDCGAQPRSLDATDWPFPWRDRANTAAAPAAAAPEGSLVEQWRVSWPAEAATLGRPVVVDGAVYAPMTSVRPRATGGDDARLYAIGADGNERWYLGTREDMGVPTVAAVDGTILCLVDTEAATRILYALNTDGTVRWRDELTILQTPLPVPLGGGGRIYLPDPTVVGNRTGVYALELADGRRCWERVVEGRLGGRPAFADDRVVYATGGEVLALAASSGATRWRVPVFGATAEVPLIRDDRVYVGTDRRLLALSLADGGVVWSRSVPADRRLRLGSVTENALVYATYTLGDDGPPDRLVTRDPATGERRWAVALGPRSDEAENESRTDTESAAIAPPAIAGDEAFVAVQPGGGRATSLVRVDLTDGRVRERIALPGWTDRPPAVADGRVVVVTDAAVVALAGQG